MPELIRRICALRGIESEGGVGGVTEEDVRRAVETMGPLGSGLELIELGTSSNGAASSGRRPGGGGGTDSSRKALRSGSALVNSDSASLVGLAMSTGGRLTIDVCVNMLGWRRDRARAVLEDEMVEREGIAWVDEQSDETGGREWWVSGVVEWGE